MSKQKQLRLKYVGGKGTLKSKIFVFIAVQQNREFYTYADVQCIASDFFML